MDHAAGPGIGRHGAEQAWDVDPEMVVEPAVFSRERGLDQMIGEFVEPQRVVVLDAPRAQLVAIAIEEGDGELRFLEPVVVGSFAESGNRKRQHDEDAAGAERHYLRERLHEIPPPPARDMKAVHEFGEALIQLASPGLGLVEPEIDARIEIKEKTVQPRFPAAAVLVVVEEVAQSTLGRKRAVGGAGPSSRLECCSRNGGSKL